MTRTGVVQRSGYFSHGLAIVPFGDIPKLVQRPQFRPSELILGKASPLKSQAVSRLIQRSRCSSCAEEIVRQFQAQQGLALRCNNQIDADAVGKLLEDIHHALAGLGQQQAGKGPPEPVVSVRASVKKDYLVCLICGAKMKMLKRHMSAEHGMSPQEYRDAYKLGQEHPMVAANYAETRRDLAKKIGLGRNPQQKRNRKAGTANKKANGSK